MKEKVVAYKHLPPRLPWPYTILLYLFLDRLEAAEWVWGAVGLFLAFWWIMAIISYFKCEYSNPFDERKV